MSKTATQLTIEYWNKPPIERVKNTVQDYVFDYQQSIIDELNSKVVELNSKIESALDFIAAVELSDNKPDGATHYRKLFTLYNNAIVYYKHQFGKWYYYREKFGWFPSVSVTSIDQLKDL